MVAPVSPWVDDPRLEPAVVPADSAGSSRGQRRKGVVLLAAGGYVVWSETYDRPLGDKLWVQDDIAREVTKELQAAIH